MTSLSEEIHYTPDSISFSVFSPSEIRALSKLEITNTISINDLGQPIPKGLYDLRMGPYMRNYGICATCHLNYVHCPGHLGHIELAMPVINPLFRSVLMSMLSRCCLYCSALLYPAPMLVLTSVQLDLLRRGLTAEAASASDLFSMAGSGVSTRGSKGAAAAEIDALDDAPTKETSSESVRRLRGFLEGVIATQGVSSEVATDVRNVVLERRCVLKRFLGYKPLKDCPECHKHQPSLNDFLGQIVKIEKNVTRTRRKKGEKMLDSGEVRSYLTSLEARDVLRKLWHREQKLLCEVFGVLQTAQQSNHDNPTDCFFIEALPVTSPRLRPMDSVNGRHSEHSHTFLYNSVLVCSQLLKRLLVVRKTGQSVDDLPADDARAIRSVKGNSLDEKIMRTWGNLQGLVDCVVDVDMNKYTAKRLKVKDLRGIRQVLEKKEGILRMNMMGKRVDYAGRTVITPDPYLSVEEMGVPEVMAKRLTYPEPVTALNLSSLQQAVLNGPNVHPGANAIEFGNGVKVVLKDDKKQLTSSAGGLLTPVDQQSRKMMAPKVVHRHLNTGDVVLLNRQPTLHRPSIMAHRVRVLPSEKTFRLHYSNCKCYNADFDGDEMNIHLPQGEEARSEAFNLAFSPYHFLVPKDGTPLGGLIQDHVIAGVVLSMRDRCFRRAEYLQLVASGLATLRHRIKTLPPAILKPGPFWTGKQVISTIIINLTPSGRPAINLQSVANLNPRMWQRAPPRPWTVGGPIVEPDLSEGEVIIRDGHLLCGVLDKKQFGAVPFSLVHGFYELYGGIASSALLSAFSRLFTHCLQIFGFTLGVRDILVMAEADRQRQRTTMNLMEIGCNATCEALDIKSEEECADLDLVRRRLEVCHLAKDPRATRDMDRAYKQRLDVVNNDINKACLPRGLIEKFPENNLQLMVESGAKGSKVNTMQISCLLGQIELEGKRPPRMLSGKTLPSFVAYDLTPRAGGFISGRFMTGIRPQEYFFHCMAGREGLIDTAVKTSRSGYLQRCLIKHLEGLIVGYDLSVRDSDGSVIQFRYGEDGHETQKVQYLTEKQMSFFERNHLGVVDNETLENFKGRSDTHKVNKTKKRIRRWRREFGSPPRKQRSSPFLEFCRRLDLEQVNTEFGGEHKRKKLGDLWRRVADRSPYEKLCRPCPDPVNSTHHPDAHFSSVSEHLENLIASYVRHRAGSEQLSDLLYYKCARSCVQPGEAVGLVAAQSIGEPSTQMTLNTFHFAGRGDMNVTLGIPRLKEILGASKSMKTPSMEIPFRRDVPDLRSQAQRLKLQLTRVTLAQVLRDVTVTERLHLGRSRVYKLHLRFLPRSAYKHELPVTPAVVVRFVENTWIRQLIRKLSKALKFRDVDGVLGNKEADAEAAAASAGDVLEDEDAAVDNPADEPATVEGDGGGNAGASSDEEVNDEEDAKGARWRARQKDEGEYESEDEGDDDAQDAEALLVDGEDADDSLPAFTTSSNNISMSQRQITVLTQRTDNCTVDTYAYDQKSERWCEFTITAATNRQCDIQSLVRDAAVLGVIREVPQIRRAFVVDDQSGGLQLCTEGINMLYMVRFSNLLDLSRMYCNDLHSMAATYGVEAASKAIVREIGTVFGVYGIKVNARHLSLVADYMTFSGGVAGFNRSAMEAVVSPLQQMTFETTVRFLRSAVLSGQGDDLKSPSARLIFGQPFTGGTGMFSLINKLV